MCNLRALKTATGPVQQGFSFKDLFCEIHTPATQEEEDGDDDDFVVVESDGGEEEQTFEKVDAGSLT